MALHIEWLNAKEAFSSYGMAPDNLVMQRIGASEAMVLI